MAQLAIATAVGVSKAIGAYKKSKAHEAQAAEYVEAKNRRMAATTRELSEEARKADYIKSKAVAIAAASGAAGPGVVRIMGDIAAEGKYRVMSTLWQGLNDADGLMHKAEVEKQAAKDTLVVGVISAFTSGASAFASSGGSFGGDNTPPPSTVIDPTSSLGDTDIYNPGVRYV